MNYVNALTLFREGKDTAEIAATLGCSEATAYNEIHRLKQEERPPRRKGSKPSPAVIRKIGKAMVRRHSPHLVRYAGFDPSERQTREAAE